MIFFLLITLFLVIVSIVRNTNTVVVKCKSFSCGYNRVGKCKRINIEVYDNGVLGLCLWHTAKMGERVVEPFLKGREIGKKDGEIAIIDKLLKDTEDMRAVKDPEEFKQWLKKHGII